jgi:predicted esterase YcpF (UPF0227 family)
VILYLHGFRSSPQSFKARVMHARLAELGRLGEWQCPPLPVSPCDAVALAESVAANAKTSDVTVVGSSLGGYYATYLAEKHGWRAVLLNPAVMAAARSPYCRVILTNCARSRSRRSRGPSATI